MGLFNLPLPDITQYLSPKKEDEENVWLKNAREYLSRDLQREARDAADRELETGDYKKKGVWAALNRWGRRALEVQEYQKDPKTYRNPEERAFQRILKEYEAKAPALQRDLSAWEAMKQREEASRLKADVDREKIMSAFKLGAEKNKISKETLALNEKKYEAMLPVWGAQATLEAAKADEQKMQTEFAEKHGYKMGTDPSQALVQRGLATDPKQQAGAIIQSILGRGGRGGSSTSTTYGTKQVTDPITGITYEAPSDVPRISTRSFGGGGGQGELTDHPLLGAGLNFLKGGTNAATPLPDEKKRTPPAIPPLSGPPRPITSPTKPARWWEHPIPQGRMSEEVRSKHLGKRQTLDGLSRVTTLFNNALSSGPPIKLGTGPISSSQYVMLAKQVLDKIKPQEAMLRADLSKIQAKELLEFTGKVANERDRELINNMVPNPKDSLISVITKTFFLRLASERERFLMGDVIQNKAGMKQELHEKFGPGDLVGKAERLTKRFLAGKPVTDADFDMKSYYQPELTKLGIVP